MYEYISGKLSEVTPTYAVVEAAGMGYMVNISLHTFSQIESMTGSETKLFLHYIVREDAQILYGFSSKVERELFKMLISVSGVGGNTARMVLSTYSPNELKSIISTENAALLKCVKGLGLKTAQKIIVDLSGKIISVGDDDGAIITETTKVSSQNTTQNEAIEALVMLGFSKAACQKIVGDEVKNSPMSSVEEIIRSSLKRL
ncbi:MAG: Holliday junction branch migration protein RuvA [Rikenellaceae bacterium]